MYTFEIYLTKKKVSKDEWSDLIKSISNYNGFMKPWKIVILNNKNQVRYFVKTKCLLPTTINNLNSFLLKKYKNIRLPKVNVSYFTITKNSNNFIDLVNYSTIRNKGKLKILEINFIKIGNDFTLSNSSYYLLKNKNLKKYNLLFSIPTNILSIDFEGNKRFFYKNCPKYLDINKILHILDTDSNNALLNIDTFPYLQGSFFLNQNNFSFDKHSVIFGSSGSGKSKLISLLVNNIYKNKNISQRYKIVIIDPHASLEDEIGGIGKVIDFKNDLDTIDLFVNNSEDIVSSCELLLELFKSLIADQYNSKLERVLRHSIYLLLTYKEFNFNNLRKIILDLEFRNNLLKEMNDVLPDSVIDFFLSDFNDLKTKSYGEAISPIIGFIDEMEMVPVFNSYLNYNNLFDTLNDNFLTIFSLNRIKLGDKVTKAISGLIMQQLLTIIQKRCFNQHIIFIVDEVSVVENPILCRYLSEARKYNLSLILAGQYFNQISDELKTSIFANVINYFIFRVSKLDASVLVDNFNMKVPLDDSKENKIKILSELNNRECIVRVESDGKLLPAFKATTIDYNGIPRKNIINKKTNNNEDKSEFEYDMNFKLDCNLNLKDILISNSTSRKVVKK